MSKSANKSLLLIFTVLAVNTDMHEHRHSLIFAVKIRRKVMKMQYVVSPSSDVTFYILSCVSCPNSVTVSLAAIKI